MKPSAKRVSARYAAAKRRSLKLYHGTSHAEEVLTKGFDLTKVKPRWKNDYAISTLSDLQETVSYNGGAKRAGFQIIEMTFSGMVVEYGDPILPGSSEKLSPQEYTKRVVMAGIDAVLFGQGRKKMVYIYNPRSIKDMKIVWGAQNF